jgi:hypothetical protein
MRKPLLSRRAGRARSFIGTWAGEPNEPPGSCRPGAAQRASFRVDPHESVEDAGVDRIGSHLGGVHGRRSADVRPDRLPDALARQGCTPWGTATSAGAAWSRRTPRRRPRRCPLRSGDVDAVVRFATLLGLVVREPPALTRLTTPPRWWSRSHSTDFSEVLRLPGASRRGVRDGGQHQHQAQQRRARREHPPPQRHPAVSPAPDRPTGGRWVVVDLGLEGRLGWDGGSSGAVDRTHPSERSPDRTKPQMRARLISQELARLLPNRSNRYPDPDPGVRRRLQVGELAQPTIEPLAKR